MKRVLVFGAFDGLHPGHLNFFEQAKKYGDFLIVSVGTDNNVEKIKGKLPLFSQGERLVLVRNLKIVDETVLGEEENYWEGIKKISPDIICLGYDQWASEDEVKDKLAQVGLENVEIYRLRPYLEDRAKSTFVKKKSVDIS